MKTVVMVCLDPGEVVQKASMVKLEVLCLKNFRWPEMCKELAFTTQILFARGRRQWKRYRVTWTSLLLFKAADSKNLSL